MKLAWIVPLAALLLAGCAAAERRPAPGMPVDPALQAQAVRDLLAQAADAAVNRLGRPDGYWLNARARIALPEDLAQLDRQLRRFGMDKLLDEFELGLNRAAEAAMPGVKPVLLDAIRDLPVENAASIVRGDAHAASRYFRAHSRDELAVRVQPLMSRATARIGVTAQYKRLHRKAASQLRTADLSKLDVDVYLTREALEGVYRVMAEEERQLRQDRDSRSSELLKRVFR
jgi:hypothetical protein